MTGMVVHRRIWLVRIPQEVDGPGLILFLAYLSFSLNRGEENTEFCLQELLCLLLNTL